MLRKTRVSVSSYEASMSVTATTLASPHETPMSTIVTSYASLYEASMFALASLHESSIHVVVTRFASLVELLLHLRVDESCMLY